MMGVSTKERFAFEERAALSPGKARAPMPAPRRNSNRPRIAVVGCGRMAAKVHLPSLARLGATNRCDLVAACDLNAQAAAETASRFGFAQAYTDLDAMLKAERPDGVVVLTQTAVMARVAGRVLRKGFPVMLEKPPGQSAKECRSLIRAAAAGKRGGVKHMVAFNRRFCPFLVQAHTLQAGMVAQGASGLMYRAGRQDADFWTTAIHSIDALRYLASAGGGMAEVETERMVLPGDKAASFIMRIGYASGGAGTLSIRPVAGVRLEEYDLFAGNRVARVRFCMGWPHDAPGDCRLYEGDRQLPVADALKPFAKLRAKKDLFGAIQAGFYGENAAFVEALATGKPMGPSLPESLASVEIGEAMQAGRRWKLRAAQ